MTHSIFRRFVIVVALSATSAVVVPATISALSTAQVEGALENGVQTAVNWDQGCRSHLSNYPNATFRGRGENNLRTQINRAASYVISMWLSRDGYGNASTPLTVDYGTSQIPLQINNVTFLCGPLVASDLGCSSSITGSRLVNDSSRWVSSAGDANDRRPNRLGSGCMYPSKTFVRRYIVGLDIDRSQTTYGGRIEGGVGSHLFSLRQDSTRYWLSTPSRIRYVPDGPITRSGQIVVRMYYKSYSGYHSANEWAATKKCDWTVPDVTAAKSNLNINRCATNSVDLKIKIVLKQNFTLTPRIAVTPNAVPEGSGSAITVTPSVQNAGPTATDDSINWRVTRFDVAPGTNYSMGGSPDEPCTQITGEKPGSCTTIKSGSTQFNIGSTPLEVLSNTIAPDVPAGTRVCYVTSVEKGSTANPTWKHSSVDCVRVERIPLVHVIGNDARVGSGFFNTADARSKIVGSVSTAGGSTGEYGVIAPGAVDSFSSAAGAINGSSAAQSTWSGLTFANSFSTAPTCAPSFGCFGSVGKIPKAAEFFTSPANKNIIEQCNLGAQNVTLSALGSYTCIGGNRLNTPQHDIGSYRRSTVIYTTGNVTIDKDMVYSQDPLQGDNEIPQLVIVANNITVSEPVQRVDAWMIARGELATCNIAPPLTVSQCNKQLKTNGPVMASRLRLNRTYYNSTSKAAAERMTLRPSSYVWANQLVRKRGAWQTAYITELPPRY